MRWAKETTALSHHPSAPLLAFVKRQVTQTELYAGQERRGEFRHLLVKPVEVYPADEHFSPVGPPQLMVIRDISARGLGLVYEDLFKSQQILVRISLPSIEAILGANVQWNRPVGPFYHIGCEIAPQFDSIDTCLAVDRRP
jgi:hypothetical protein